MNYRINLFLKEKLNQKILLILICILTIFSYYKSFYNGLYLEDINIFSEKYENTLWKNFYSGYDHTYISGEFAYRPLIKAFFVLEKKIFQKKLYYYHLISLIMHLLNIVMGYFFFINRKIN